VDLDDRVSGVNPRPSQIFRLKAEAKRKKQIVPLAEVTRKKWTFRNKRGAEGGSYRDKI
jgi:hypothetical protein